MNNCVVLSCIVFIAFLCFPKVFWCMNLSEKNELRLQVKEMFYHAFRAYMENAYPADELMPLSCRGRFRDVEPSRGDVDDALGNFSLTLVDSLDTLVILGDFDEFERAVKRVIQDVKFDNDVVVSVFETNIRMIGGLLSAHVLGRYLQEELHRMSWYQGELLSMARDLGFRLLPAFNTSTGVPHPRINLRHGLNSPKLGVVRETCTACAGTMILEFAALSRLTGEPLFEEKARAAMDYLWKQRHRTSHLMGTVLNIHNGDWIRRDSGVGAGIDSYYEYCLKAYILLGDSVFLERFNKHYSAVMKYVRQGPLLVDVHMHRPHTNSRNFMDSLLAFWPGLQVLKGDIKPAIQTHEMLYQVMQRHNFLPEAFTTDFQVHWGQHPLRPEFVESTYFLYKATNDPYYLEVGKKVLRSLQSHARVPCGFAAVKDVRTGSHEDRMDSFVLAETLKYLYLLFASKEELSLEIDDFVFTTEAHLLPLNLARITNETAQKYSGEENTEDFLQSCPNTPDGRSFAQSIRLPLKNLVEGVCPTTKLHRTLVASEFQVDNLQHVEAVRKMGIAVLKLSDGRIKLVRNASQAETSQLADEGIVFMQEMIEFSKTITQNDQMRIVYFYLRDNPAKAILHAGPAQFGMDLKGRPPIESRMQLAEPFKACSPITNVEELNQKIAVVERGDCMFVDKARHLQKAGAIAGIVLDNHWESSSEAFPIFAMSGDEKDDISIPLVFLFAVEGAALLSAFHKHPTLIVGLAARLDDSTPEAVPKLSPDLEAAPKSRAQYLLGKLQNLLQIKADLDQILSAALESREASQRLAKDRDLRLAIQQLVGEGKMAKLDQDLQTVLGHVPRAATSPSPSSSLQAFGSFLAGQVPKRNVCPSNSEAGHL